MARKLFCIVVIAVCIIAISAKPVKQLVKPNKQAAKPALVHKPVVKVTTTTTTEAPAAAEDNAVFASIGGTQMSCDEWMDSKLAASGMTMEDLASAIVEPQHRDLALEFLLFCMMDETPMANRQNVLQDEIRKASAIAAKV